MSEELHPLSNSNERGPESTAEMLEEVHEDGFSLSDQLIADFADALDEGEVETLKTILNDLSEADVAELFHKMDREARHIFLDKHADLIDPLVYSHLSPELREIILSDMPPAAVAKILSELESDDALDLIIDLDAQFQKEILRYLSAKNRLALEEGLSYPEESAGRLMQREYVAIPQFWTVGKTIDYLRAAGDDIPEDFYDLIVIDPYYHVIGEIPLNKLVRAKRSEKINEIAREDIHIIPATMDQEEVAHLFRREDLGSAPVVDEDGRLVGVITIDDVIDVIDEEAGEDILKLAGVDESDLYSAVLSTSLSRSKWLLVNLLTAFIAASVVSMFGATIEKVVALAALMPIVAGMGGNAGTQALTVAVRAIAMRELSNTNAGRAIIKEGLVGLINGCVFAVLVGAIAALWFHNIILGGVIAMALVINLISAGLFGAGIPILLNKYGQDPAISSSIFLTTVTDTVGFFAFLGLATIFLA
ncbi:MAG: magnesium transporter [Micavibrio aeruginosavorus]|uniref:Magnesium transporter MgtE n=1 Tax=Micavibrio aeruginosavorus TaxID=349221 RepID=A0A2W5PUA2_9BACT|nr:MAG: magnesium transporter [Micavibrio aeruginosavorus]